MAKSSKSQKRAERELRKIQNAGFTAFAIGFVLLVAPTFLKSSKLLAPLATQLGSLAYWMIFIGIGLIGLYVLLKPKDENDEDYSSVSKAEPKPILQKKMSPNPKGLVEPTLVSKIANDINSKPNCQWSKQVFADIEWRRFEAVCEGFFAQGGFKTKSQSHGADGGVDIWMYSDHAEGPVSIAQCKSRSKAEVTVDHVRAFYGVMASHKLQRGTFVTNSTYTAPAQKFANENGIHILDGDKLLTIILTRTPEQQKELLNIAYEGEYSIPTCPSCGIKLIERTAKASGKKFFGCISYPKCRITREFANA
jgi:restriction system protein